MWRLDSVSCSPIEEAVCTVKFYGWRRAELNSWLKWVPDVEQFEMFPEVPEETPGVDRHPVQGYLDSTVSVSAKQEQEHDLGDDWIEARRADSLELVR